MQPASRNPAETARSQAQRTALARDRALLERWRDGEPAAGEELLDHYAPFVRQVARRMGIRSENDFLDFWQELVMRLLTHLPHLHERVHKSFAGYLAWQIRDLAPRFRVRRERTGPPPEPPVQDRDQIEQNEFWRAVADCEAALPAGESAVFALRFRDGLSLGEVATRTMSNANAVAQMVFRLVRRMRACLEHRGYGFAEGDE